MKHKLVAFLVAVFVVWAVRAQAQPRVPVLANTAAATGTFVIQNPDYERSPHTGMTRQHWKDAAKYLLEGAFSYVNKLDDPMSFPKQPGRSYGPNNTERLESLCRTLFMAAPLLKEEPDLQLNGIRVGDYYRHQLVKLITPGSSTYIAPRTGGYNQTLVEFGGLAVSLFFIPEILWQPLTQAQKDALAATMISYGDGTTVDSNWKFFNIFILSFFKEQGYAVNEARLVDYLQKSLGHYRGDGWYNDNPAYDYYSKWAFQMYGPLWAEFFGKKHYPELATRFLENFRPVKDNYPYMFSRKGEMIMWGRSIAYRFAAVVPFPLMGLNPETGTNYGWMRRIASGSLLQFLQNPNFVAVDRIPTIGWFGAFEPAVQTYSCRGSVFWMGKAFLGLWVPEDNPFWTETENEGAWEAELAAGEVYNKFHEGSDILVTDYPGIGASEIRAWSHRRAADDWQHSLSTENYNRLAYNSAFPWQADAAGTVAMNYVIRNAANQWEPGRLYTFRKFEDGIYYRDVVLESNRLVQLNLADIPLPNGILRIDRNVSLVPTQVRLGHYALPQKSGTITKETRTVKGHEVQLIDNGEYQLAMVALRGWDRMETIESTGLNPVSNRSAVINVSGSVSPVAGEPVVYATLMLWKKSGETWTDDELVPVEQISQTGSGITVTFAGGSTKTVNLAYFTMSVPPLTEGVYKITARHSGKALQVSGGASENGAAVQQWEYSGTDNQKWQVEQVDGSLYKLTNLQSYKVLDLRLSSTADGALLQQWDWTNGANQKWNIEDTADGFMRILSQHSGKSVDVQKSSTDNGATVHQWAYWGGNNQQWKFERVSGVTGAAKDEAGMAGTVLAVYPNPAAERAFACFKVQQTGKVLVELFHVNGQLKRKPYSGTAIAGEEFVIPVDTRGLQPGIYVLRLTSAGGSRNVKLVVR
ncbi:DUF2264 domain-containing protein [Botryobacter ruber]|uniref:DUF2264 domain-containing protein n=1 Tax=Botryobacter ruber TaxID=2171629 RepID=UPI000E0BAD25|nr:DUF2264 domain-containing protein [Botryobacter ruber]